MKRFSQIQKNTTKKIFEAEKYEDLSKEELIRLVSVKNDVVDNSVDNKNNTKKPIEKFFSKLFESRQMAHVYHLQVKGDMGSHAKHVALQEYYEGQEEGEGGILDTLDPLIEIYQAQFGLIEDYQMIDTSSTNTKDPIEYFTDLADFVKRERHICFDKEDTQYFNLIDDVLVLIYRLLYKLKYTK